MTRALRSMGEVPEVGATREGGDRGPFIYHPGNGLFRMYTRVGATPGPCSQGNPVDLMRGLVVAGGIHGRRCFGAPTRTGRRPEILVWCLYFHRADSAFPQQARSMVSNSGSTDISNEFCCVQTRMVFSRQSERHGYHKPTRTCWLHLSDTSWATFLRRCANPLGSLWLGSLHNYTVGLDATGLGPSRKIQCFAAFCNVYL